MGSWLNDLSFFHVIPPAWKGNSFSEREYVGYDNLEHYPVNANFVSLMKMHEIIRQDFSTYEVFSKGFNPCLHLFGLDWHKIVHFAIMFILKTGFLCI